jgi:hypothetical protein
MGGVLDVCPGGILGWFGYWLANRRLHLIWIGLRHDPVEIQIHQGLIDAVETLQVRECHEPVISETLRLVIGQLGSRADCNERDTQASHQGQGEAALRCVFLLAGRA